MDEFINHDHLCELKMLYGNRSKRYCPFKFKDEHHDECDECEHLRIVELNEDGTKIREII